MKSNLVSYALLVAPVLLKVRHGHEHARAHTHAHTNTRTFAHNMRVNAAVQIHVYIHVQYRACWVGFSLCIIIQRGTR